MTAAPEPVQIPVPRHSAPEESLPTPLAAPEHRVGRHAAPEDDGTQADEDPLAWLGFRFERA